MSVEISPALRELLSRHVRSIEALEVLVSLHGEGDQVSAAILAQRLRLAPEATQTAVEELIQAGLATAEGALVRYHAGDPVLAERVGELVEVYGRQRVDLLVLISTNAMDRVRKGALRTVSEAFRVRGPKKDG